MNQAESLTLQAVNHRSLGLSSSVFRTLSQIDFSYASSQAVPPSRVDVEDEGVRGGTLRPVPSGASHPLGRLGDTPTAAARQPPTPEASGKQGRGLFCGCSLHRFHTEFVPCVTCRPCVWVQVNGISLGTETLSLPSPLSRVEETRGSRDRMDGARGHGSRWERWRINSEDVRTEISS